MSEHYFLGSSSPCGFVTPIKELLSDTDNTVYILKGTAGCGKSTLMKKISDAFSDEPQEIYHCSSDPHSLDAVYLKNRKAMIMDGTAPHCFDPVYPKAVESIIDLGAYLDTAKLRKSKKDIITVTDECAGFHKRCRLCLAAISSVISDMLSAAAEALDTDKLSGFTERTSKRLIPKKAEKQCGGRVTAKQLSAMTMNGYMTYLPEYEKIYLLSDSFMAGSDLFLRDISEAAVKKGYDVIVSRCPLCTEMYYEHVLIPELGIAFISSGCINSITVEGSKKVINFRRFYSPTPIIKQRLKFGKKAASEIIREAACAMQSAKDIHDKLEKYYVSAADHDSLNRLSYKLISEIKSL